jgi:hypothetical protein
MGAQIQKINLLPFQTDADQKKIQLSVVIQRTGSLLELTYELHGEIDQILIPQKKNHPERLDYLWEHTCYEAFICTDRDAGYWEANISPSGDWNFYRFEEYRKGQSVESKLDRIESQVGTSSSIFSLKAKLDLLGVISSSHSEPINLGLTAVIEGKNAAKSYWAVRHSGQKPDFHLRQSFAIKI